MKKKTDLPKRLHLHPQRIPIMRQGSLAGVVRGAKHIRGDAPDGTNVDDEALRFDKGTVEMVHHPHGPEDVDAEHFFDGGDVRVDGCHGVACHISISAPQSQRYI